MAPDPGTNAGYWEGFLREMVGRLRGRWSVEVVPPSHTECIPAGRGPVVGVAPQGPPPEARPLVWIPRVGESVERSHPWAVADQVLLPLGVGPVDETLPVSFLGLGMAPPRHVPSGRCVWVPSSPDGVLHLMAALADGHIPLVDETDPVLRFLVEQYRVGLACNGPQEAELVAECVRRDGGLVALMAWYQRRFSRRVLAWSRVAERLEAGILTACGARPRVWTVVLNWNGVSFLGACLESLRLQAMPGHVPLVVDNGSTDGSVELVRNAFPECRLLRNERNLGFAQGNNQGIRHALEAGADYVVLLNNDTIVARGWLRALVEAAEEEPGLGVVGSKMLFATEPRILNSAGVTMNQGFYGWDVGVFEHDGPDWRRPRECLFVTGGSMLLRASALRRVGLFDEEYFAYYEDVDLCHRMRLAGWSVGFQPKSRVFHRHSATSGAASDWKTFLMERSRYRFILKNVPLSYLIIHGASLLRQELSELRAWWRGREYRRMLTQVRAAADAVRRLPNILWWRLYRGTGGDHGWTRTLSPGFQRPQFPVPEPEFFDIFESTSPRGRCVVPYSQRPLRGAWSASTDTFPKFRWLQGRGAVTTTTPGVARGYLQLHVFLPPGAPPCSLKVLSPWVENGVHVLPHPGWSTLLFRAHSVPPRAVVELESETALGINEVSILPEDSPLLRVC